MKNNFLVYLAGPITGLDFRGATSWRDQVNVELSDTSIRTLSPMRGKQYLLNELSIADHYESQVMSTLKAINTRDYYDVRRADAILVNVLGAKKVSIGTVMEIAWARAFNIPVVLVMEKGNIHSHGMLQYACGYEVETLEEGIAVLKALLLPDDVMVPPHIGSIMSRELQNAAKG